MGCCGSVADPNTYLVPHGNGNGSSKTLVDGLVGLGPSQPFTVEPWMTSKKTNPPQILKMMDAQNKVVFSMSGQCHPREDTQLYAADKLVAVLRTAQSKAPTSQAGWEQTSWLILGVEPRAQNQSAYANEGGQSLYLWGKLTRYPMTNKTKLWRILPRDVRT